MISTFGFLESDVVTEASTKLEIILYYNLWRPGLQAAAAVRGLI
jgi:hypothetical protein